MSYSGLQRHFWAVQGRRVELLLFQLCFSLKRFVSWNVPCDPAGMVHAQGIDLASLLRFEPQEGRILLQGYRLVLLSACALGALRRELIETLGLEQARALLKRFGHAAGLADGLALTERFPDASRREHLDFGPALHALEGVAHVVRIPEGTDFDLENGRCRFEAYWENSYEAEQHLELFGQSTEPVCWSLVGYATGHSSSAAGRRTIVHEVECRAMGHARCRFVGDFADNLPEITAREEPDYQKRHLPALLEELLGTIRRQKRHLAAHKRQISGLREELEQERGQRPLIGESPAWRSVLETARTLAPVDVRVLILGPSGSGKELVARYLHEHSLRAHKPFVAINCSALPANLQEAELFGYAKGAFTGASGANAGLFEAADGGTLFLDEIGDLASSAQTAILRALQEGEIKRLGETRTRKVDVRVLAATHRDLKALVAEGRFREDLFYRLAVVSLPVPALAERGHDVLLLAEHFLKRFARQFAKPAARFSRAAAELLLAHPWPGNVRELEHAIQRAVILSSRAEIALGDLPPELLAGRGPVSAPTASAAASAASRPALASPSASKPHPNSGPTSPNPPPTSPNPAPRSPNPAPLAPHQTPGAAPAAHLDEAERIRQALLAAGGRRHAAAQALGLSRTTLWRRMRALGLD
jgi:DNA-binding NtrC family response regulator